MNRKSIVTCSLLVLCLAASGALAQVMMRHGSSEEENDIVLLHELGIVVGFMPDSDDARVLVLLPDADPALELKKDDLVLMINGERIRDLATLRAAYESAAMGDTVKVGFRRGDRRFLRSFEKKKAEEGREVRMVMAGGPGHDFSDMQPMPEFGVVLGEKDGKIQVAMELPMGDPALKKDDWVKSINGTDVESLAALREVYEPLAVGADVALVVVRGGEEVSASRAKTEFEGVMKVRREP